MTIHNMKNQIHTPNNMRLSMGYWQQRVHTTKN